MTGNLRNRAVDSVFGRGLRFQSLASNSANPPGAVSPIQPTSTVRGIVLFQGSFLRRLRIRQAALRYRRAAGGLFHYAERQDRHVFLDEVQTMSNGSMSENTGAIRRTVLGRVLRCQLREVCCSPFSWGCGSLLDSGSLVPLVLAYSTSNRAFLDLGLVRHLRLRLWGASHGSRDARP